MSAPDLVTFVAILPIFVVRGKRLPWRAHTNSAMWQFSHWLVVCARHRRIDMLSQKGHNRITGGWMAVFASNRRGGVSGFLERPKNEQA
jgi:hypothetical protein